MSKDEMTVKVVHDSVPGAARIVFKYLEEKHIFEFTAWRDKEEISALLPKREKIDRFQLILDYEQVAQLRDELNKLSK